MDETHVSGGDSGPYIRLLAICCGRAVHVAFHEGEAGAAGAGAGVSAGGADGQVSCSNRAYLVELF